MKDLEKKLTDAFIAYTNKAYGTQNLNPKGFESKVKWLIDTFKESIWHEASEKPKKKHLITKVQNHCGNIIYEIVEVWDDWDEYTIYHDVLQWCYLSDIIKEN